MKLDRNINPDQGGKYALVKMRKVREMEAQGHAEIKAAIDLLHKVGVIDFGTNDNTDFFVIRLKDKYAWAALAAYAIDASEDDKEYADEIMDLANRAHAHPLKRIPD